MLEIVNLSKTYRKDTVTITALHQVCLSVQRGEFVAVHGPSGCGKTTLLLIAGGLLHPDTGTARVAGHDLYELSAEARAKFRAANIGFVFQQFHLIDYLTVLDNVLASSLALPVPAARAKAVELLENFGLGHRISHRPAELSTGERQRTALARALLHQPKLLLADEPTGNLDEENGRVVLEHLATHARDSGAVLLVTHDQRAAAFADRVIALGDSGVRHPEKV
jgi:ABC-type lipoprotein export system ATPase subunit